MWVVLADRGDEINVIEEEREEWVNNVLIALGVPQEILTYNKDIIKTHLLSLQIEIWQNEKGAIDIYKDDKIIAQWKEPKLNLIKEPKSMYYEIQINAWALPLQKTY